mmetsp:Transcript_8050/g.20337  ORF Transcript_8050/g.20337 Transcript_8050/m.20337 type:complete len:229 (-) Transcript_8050:26-712(-)
MSATSVSFHVLLTFDSLMTFDLYLYNYSGLAIHTLDTSHRRACSPHGPRARDGLGHRQVLLVVLLALHQVVVDLLGGHAHVRVAVRGLLLQERLDLVRLHALEGVRARQEAAAVDGLLHGQLVGLQLLVALLPRLLRLVVLVGAVAGDEHQRGAERHPVQLSPGAHGALHALAAQHGPLPREHHERQGVVGGLGGRGGVGGVGRRRGRRRSRGCSCFGERGWFRRRRL